MICRIEEMPASRVAYMRRMGPYGMENHAFMEKFKKWAKASGLLTMDAAIFGISQDNPEATPPQSCRYDVCIVVGNGWSTTDTDVYEAELPGGRYAVFTIAHTAEAMKKAWSDIFLLLADQGRRADLSRPVLERYAPAMIENHLCEICVPV